MEKCIYSFLVACLLTACVAKESTQHERGAMSVKTTVVTLQSGAMPTRYVGSVEPACLTPLSMQTTGRVLAVEVKNGQRVKEGQKLLSVDNTQALNALYSAEAALRHAQDGYDRVSKVHQKGVVSDQKMVEVESQLAQAKAFYDAAKQQVSECTLVAPCDGVINGLEIEKGQTVLPGATLCSILDVSGFSVRFTVPEREIRALPNQGEVECAAVDTVLPIRVTEKGVQANPVTHTYEVVARIEGGTDVLMAGLVAKVKMKWNGAGLGEHIVIPSQCVLLKPEGPTVWLVEQGTAVRRDIVIDGYEAGGVRVKSGLQVGDTLITEGYQKLYKGCRVIEN